MIVVTFVIDEKDPRGELMIKSESGVKIEGESIPASGREAKIAEAMTVAALRAVRIGKEVIVLREGDITTLRGSLSVIQGR